MEPNSFRYGGINFKNIIEQGVCYVDKTLLLKELTEVGPDKVVLFTRPRRFGKTLNLDMIKTFFELEIDKQGKILPLEERKNTNLFNNLAISEYPEVLKHLGLYSIISISFSGISGDTWEETYNSIKVGIAEIFTHFSFLDKIGFLEPNQSAVFQEILFKKAPFEELTKSFYYLSSWLSDFYNKEIIITIDEYDSILINAYINNYYIEAVKFIKKFFNFTLKDNDKLHLGYVTGIFRTAKESIFSGLNNIIVYPVTEPKCSQYFGFTEKEVMEIAAKYGQHSKMEEIRKWYDGYNFGGIEIYNPWSILNYFFFNNTPQAYWLNTSDNQLIIDMLKNSTVDIKNKLTLLSERQSINCQIDDSIVFGDLKSKPESIWTFLLSSGYLRTNNLVDSNTKLYSVSVPNKEIASLFENLVLACVESIFIDKVLQSTVDSLLEGDVEGFQKAFNECIDEDLSVEDHHEFVYHGYVLACLRAMKKHKKISVSSNGSSGLGYYDILITPSDDSNFTSGIILEFKKTKTVVKKKTILPEDVVFASLTALEQIVEKKYDNAVNFRKIENKLLYGIAFHQKKCFAVLQKNESPILQAGDGTKINIENLDKTSVLYKKYFS
jgi:hypothetical protein